jgi:acetyl-CoA acyltransferase
VGAGVDALGPRFASRYPEGLVPQGISAELIAARWSLGRAELDEFSASSHAKAAAATADGLFAGEVAPIKAPGPDGALREVSVDETIRPGSSVASLAGLRPAFYDESLAQRFPQIRWHVTAGNSSPLNDGSAAVLIMSSERAASLGLRPRARVHTSVAVGDDPLYMLTGIMPATAKVLQRSGLALSDIDLFEVNEAFASVVVAWQRETGAPASKVNVNGGAISIGHPLGASGARIMTTLVNAMEQKGARYALQTMCEAGGQANATILERL